MARWEQLRKFTLEYCDLPTMLWNVAVILRVLTLNIESSYKKGIPVYYYVLMLVLTVWYYYIYFLNMAWFVFVRCAQTGDLVAAMIVLSLGLSSEIGPIKLLYMFIYIEEIRKLSDAFLACDAQVVPGSRFHVNLLKVLRNVKLRAILYWMVVFNNGNMYLLLPLIFPGKNLPDNNFIIYGLEPQFESPNYEIGWTVMAVATYYICYVPACVTAYLIIITGYTEAQVLALIEEVINVWPDAVKQTQVIMNRENINQYEPKTNFIINRYVNNRLKEIIERHAMLQTLFGNAENIFRNSILIGFILLILGLVAELLGKLENTFMEMPFSLMQVAMDCFAGQRVMDACIVLEQAVYDCKWENFDKTNMKLVQVMLQSSQKTLTLSAGGFATLNFISLMAVTRGIYSAYTTFRSTM